MRLLYLHGFTSGPRSAKAEQLRPLFAARGVALEAPDLNLPSFEHLRVSAQVRAVEQLLRGGPPALLLGSSLGGLVALHAQATAPEVAAAVVLAPALEAGERWANLAGGPAGLAEWRRRGSRPFPHMARGVTLDLDAGFLDDLFAHATPPPLRVPLEVVHGKHDVTVPLVVSERYAAREPGARLTVVDDDHGLVKSIDAIVAAIDRAVARGGLG